VSRRPEVAIIGAGRIAQWHARYAAAEGARVVAVVDREESRAEALARDFRGAQVFRDVDDCLKVTSASVVHVCTEGDHGDLADRALAAGRHAIVEKPVTRSAEEARHLVDMATNLRLVLCPVHQFVFQHGFGRVLAKRDWLGEIVRMEGAVCTEVPDDLEPSERRDVLIGIVPQFVALFRALVGPVSSVTWHIDGLTSDDLALVTHAGLTQISLFASLRGRPPRNDLLVIGTDRSARMDLFQGHCLWEKDGVTPRARAAMGNLAGRMLRREPGFPGLRALIGAAYRAVREGGPPPVPPQEIVEAAELMERLVKAARS
jgi:predicted dehydrogenase